MPGLPQLLLAHAYRRMQLLKNSKTLGMTVALLSSARCPEHLAMPLSMHRSQPNSIACHSCCGSSNRGSLGLDHDYLPKQNHRQFARWAVSYKYRAVLFLYAPSYQTVAQRHEYSGVQSMVDYQLSEGHLL